MKYSEQALSVIENPTPSYCAKAIVVAHGIGQQRPYEVLDSFVQGLVRELDDRNSPVQTEITHVKIPAGDEFDHCIRLRAPGLLLDVYEYYWASMTEGKASFGNVISWLRMTAFTPLRRLAYNIPLILQRSTNTAQACVQLLLELWRIVYIPIIVLAVTGLAAYLVDNLATLAKTLFKLINAVVSGDWAAIGFLPNAWTDKFLAVATMLIFLGILLALSSLLLSIPAQIRDMFRVQNLLHDKKPNPVSKFLKKVRVRTAGGWSNRLRQAVKQTLDEEEQWSIQIRMRRWLSVITVCGSLLLGTTAYLLVTGRESSFFLTRHFSPVVHDLITKYPTQVRQIGITLGLLCLATLLKRVFVDYVGDIALYATADENSAFFRTRIEILTQATRRIRWLLRQGQYDNVSLAGHSLGSVIMYDALSWLSVESQVDFPNPGNQPVNSASPISVREYKQLHSIITFGSPLDKIVYFFRTQVRSYETVRAHILNELHGFRMARGLSASDPRIKDSPPFEPSDEIKWLNVYSPSDPISARLAFFRGVDNYWRWYWLWGLAHLSYWHDNKFYKKVLNTII
jgi:hypothetical protein